MNILEIGEQITSEIVAISNDCVFIDLNSKSEGVVDKAELLDKDGNLTVSEGDKISVYYLGYINGEMRFTSKISSDKANASLLENAFKSGIPIEGKVEKEIKGGFEVKIGESRAFCPYSQMGFKQKEEASFYIGKVLTFKISEYKDGKNLLVSNRKALEEEHANLLEDLKSKITDGKTVEGTIVSLQNYGAFVDVLGFQALLPISEVSRTRISDISEVFEVGQKIKAKVIKTDWEHERVSLSTKALEADPWDVVEGKFSVGDKLTSPITRIADFGLFVELAKGVDGLIHVSELEDVERTTNLRKVFAVGQKMAVIIKSIDMQNKRIGLTVASTKEEDTSAQDFLNAQDDSDTYNPFAALLKKK